MPKPLAGLRVLELARILAGPWAGQMLADLGADVIKVERKGAGDDTRGWGPPFVEGADGKPIGAAYFHSANRGKRSIEADFENEEGRRIVHKLAKRSDVLIENFKVGGLAKFGLDYKSLAPENPRLIYCSVTGFGQDGPYAERAGYDLMAQGMGGFMSLTGYADGPPTRVGVAISDVFTGCYSVVGILAALAEREKTGKGCYVDCALVDSTVGVLANQGLNYLVSGEVPKRIGNSHPNIVPYQEFPVADGHIIIATGNDNQFVKLCHVLGAPELAEVPAYKDNVGRLAHRNELVAKLSALTKRMPRAASARQTRTAEGAGRSDQRPRPGVQRPASHLPRHEARSAERRRQRRQHTGRAYADRAGRLARGVRTPRAAAWRAYGGDFTRDRRELISIKRPRSAPAPRCR